MRRPDEVRHRVTKPDERFVSPERWTARDDERIRQRAVRAAAPLAWAALALALAALVLSATLPYVREITISWATLFGYRAGSPPMESGDRNGLLPPH